MARSSRWPQTIRKSLMSDKAHCDTSDEITRAKDILKRTGAEDIASAGEEAVGSTSGGEARRL